MSDGIARVFIDQDERNPITVFSALVALLAARQQPPWVPHACAATGCSVTSTVIISVNATVMAMDFHLLTCCMIDLRRDMWFWPALVSRIDDHTLRRRRTHSAPKPAGHWVRWRRTVNART